MHRSKQRDDLVGVLRSIPHVGAIAFGGSVATAGADADSDLDIFTFCDDKHLTLAIQEARIALSAAFDHTFIHGPLLSHRFGIKLFVVLPNGLWVDLFFNSPLTFYPLPMTSKMQFISDEYRIFFVEHFEQFLTNSPESEKYFLDQAIIESIDALKGMVKSIRRDIPSGFHFYAQRFAALYFALRLHECAILPFDPHIIERRFAALVEDNPQVAAIEREVCLNMDIQHVRACYEGLRQTVGRFASGEAALEHARLPSAALETMLERTLNRAGNSGDLRV